MQLKENTRYRLRNGMEVANLKKGEEFFRLPSGSPGYEEFIIPFPMWKPDGRWNSFIFTHNDPEFDIVEEI